MRDKYKNSAYNLNQQKKERLKVKRRKKIAENLTAGALLVAMSVGGAYLALEAWDKESEIRAEQTEEYRRRIEMSNLDFEKLAIEYRESFYSPETILELKQSIINEYDKLLNEYIDNYALIHGQKPEASKEKLHEIVMAADEFKQEYKEERNYEEYSEEERLVEASSLYNAKRSILEKQKEEYEIKSGYYENNLKEREKAEEEIRNINFKLNDLSEANKVIMDRHITLQIQKEGKER